MKTVRAVTLTLVVAASIALVGCGSNSNSATPTTQTAKVQRGNLVVSTTSTGNLAFTRTEDVAFDMAGNVEEVMVEAGDSVTEGQVLATLDAAAWDDQLKALQKAVTAAENNLSTAESNISSQRLSVRQAQINLQAAENALADIPAVKAAQDMVDIAQAALTAAEAMYTTNPGSYGGQIDTIRKQLNDAKANLQSVLAGTSFSLSGDVALQIAKAELNADQSQLQLDDANRAVTRAIAAKDDAAQAVQDAQDALKDAQALSPKVTAPFAGVVTKVNVAGGQAINKGAVAVQIADPTKFEVGVLVGERDIASMAIGGIATVSVDSMTAVTLPATITTIAPTATIQQGVVNYQVTVQIRSTGSSPVPSLSGNATGPTPPTGSGDPFSGGRLPQGGAQLPGAADNESTRGFGGVLPLGSGSFAASPSATLRQGLSVTVNLVTASKTNVLMVPNRAIVRQQGKTYVNLEKNGTTEQVPVNTGISNSQYTEVTSGAAEGDTVVYTATTTTTSSQNRGQGGFFPGGGILR